MKLNRIWIVAGVSLALGGLAGAQIKQVIKIIGIGAAVKQFGPQINTEMNKLTKHTDTPQATTRVVPILRVTLSGGESAIGAAQISGPKAQVNKVEAVAAPEASLFGEITIRALIPVSSKDVSSLKKVEGVAVTGIVDLKL